MAMSLEEQVAMMFSDDVVVDYNEQDVLAIIDTIEAEQDSQLKMVEEGVVHIDFDSVLHKLLAPVKNIHNPFALREVVSTPMEMGYLFTEPDGKIVSSFIGEGNEFHRDGRMQVIDKHSFRGKILDRLYQIMDATSSSKANLCLTIGRRSFRYKLPHSFWRDTPYKGNRIQDKFYNTKPDKALPIPREAYQYFHEVLGQLAEENKNIKVYASSEYEADDVVIALQKRYGGAVASIDKDVIKNAGRYGLQEAYDYTASSFISLTIEEATVFPYFQCLVGDSGDGIVGCKGIGAKTAPAILDPHGTDEPALWRAVVSTYLKMMRKLDEDASYEEAEAEATNTMRLVGMHQLQYDTQEDVYNIILWTPYEKT